YEMKALLLAAGQANRLKPLSDDYPKALVPFLNTPIISILVERLLRNKEITEIGIVVGIHKEKIIEYFNKRTEYSIAFFDQDKQLGTAHAALTPGKWLDDDMLIVAADSLISQEYIDKMIENYLNSDASAMIALEPMPFDRILRSSSVEIVNQQITRVIEKPAPWEVPTNLNCAAIYIFKQEALSYLSRISPSARGEFEIPSAINLLIKEEQRVEGTLIRRVGHFSTPEDYYHLNNKLLTERFRDSSSSLIDDSTEIPAGVEVTHCIIGPNCKILPSVQTLRNCLVLEGSTLSQSCQNQLIWYSSADTETKFLSIL
ncbi:MAG: sugar phosphate nucleotidyltransferase, partial [Promethearchaeota archaeon]